LIVTNGGIQKASTVLRMLQKKFGQLSEFEFRMYLDKPRKKSYRHYDGQLPKPRSNLACDARTPPNLSNR
jgi:hypothetical protein